MQPDCRLTAQSPLPLPTSDGQTVTSTIPRLRKDGDRMHLGARCISSAVHCAAQRGDCDVLRSELSGATATDVNALNPGHKTPLMLAVEADSPEGVDLLLRCGAKPNEGGPYGASALHIAAGSGLLSCAKNLLRAGARVNPFTLRMRRTPLHMACGSGDAAMVGLLLSFGADASVLDYKHQSPLHVAAAGGHRRCVQALIKGGAPVNLSDLDGMTPLSLAVDAGCCRELVKVDAVVSAAGFVRLLQENPGALERLLDLGVERDDTGSIDVTFRPMREIGGADCPFEGKFAHEVQRTGRWELLRHPAMEAILELTRQDTLWLCVSRLVVHLVFLIVLVSFTTTAVVYPNLAVARACLQVAVAVLNSLRLLVHFVEFLFAGKRVFYALRTWPALLTTALTFVVLFPLQDVNARSWFSITIALAFIEMTLVMESVPVWKMTRAVSSLLHVTRSIAEYLIIFMPLLTGFSFAFYIMFDDNSLFHGQFAVVHMATMILGEVDATEIGHVTSASTLGYTISNFIFILFVVMVPLVMLNLLLALTISDTRKFLSKGSSEFLKTLSATTAWNQQAAFSFDKRVRKLKHWLPRPMFEALATFSLRFKWRSTLPRPSACGTDTPIITLHPLTYDGKMVRVSVCGSKRRFRLRRQLCAGLQEIVDRKAATESDEKPTVVARERTLTRVSTVSNTEQGPPSLSNALA